MADKDRIQGSAEQAAPDAVTAPPIVGIGLIAARLSAGSKFSETREVSGRNRAGRPVMRSNQIVNGSQFPGGAADPLACLHRLATCECEDH